MASSESLKNLFSGKPTSSIEHVDSSSEQTMVQSECDFREFLHANKRRIIAETESPLNPALQQINKAGKNQTLKNAELQNPKTEKPTLQQSWDAITKTVDTLDDDSVRGYKEDIDTLLVFAGLFSAVVTAFAVESYQWLEEDPADKNVALLEQIVQQMNGQPPSPPSHFTPSPSVVRINTFWFLSLTLALVDALFGLLCKQWLREHQRQTNTPRPGQALALRWLRHHSFEQWHVPGILASLPILLEIALFLFFAGLLELLWTRHPIPFAIALAIVGFAILFYLTTAILPGLLLIRQVLQIHPNLAYDPQLIPERIPNLPPINLICPYKSPQSWLMFHLLSAMFHLSGCKKLLYFVMAACNPDWKEHSLTLDDTVRKNILNLSNWSSHDLNVVQRFSRISHCPDLNELKGFRWLVQETRDIPSMKPHVINALAELPKHLVMPAVFERWHTFTSFDDLAVGVNPDGDLFGDHVSEHASALTSQILCFRHLLTTWNYDWSVPVAGDLWQRVLKEPINGPFMRAFFHPEDVLMGQTTAWRQEILEFYMQHWDELDIYSQGKLVDTLARTVLSFLESSDHNFESTLLASSHGLDFFTFLNNKLSRVEGIANYFFYAEHWVALMSCLRRIHQLPLLYFRWVPGHFPIPHQELLENLLGDSSRISNSFIGPFLDSYKQSWDYVKIEHRKKELVRVLTHHIDSTVPMPVRARSHPNSPTKGWQHLSLPSSAIIESQQYLDFLTFVNEKLEKEPYLLWYCDAGTIEDWVDALERIRVYCRLPSGYFKPIPKVDDLTGETVGWYMPRRSKREGHRNREAYELRRVKKKETLRLVKDRELGGGYRDENEPSGSWNPSAE
ncbi:hypothetical protein E1B28_002049 [Marasmius oreades]|uniref:DUF6535 domain-containing protein n=1 Tax=Marasmius oreades TaxID=181124 RepID=A0A9P7V4U1_9AGAR|nr:uncharacterized protein E1B28_002049 [Marasmius oreades]KAG7100276.1 hypothetical protein E1B28_002049 [Marasmius oreades]